MVTNFAAGISSQPLTHGEVLDTMRENSAKIKQLIMKTIELIEIDSQDCACQHALGEYGGFKL
jgi:5'-methylthioadenosine phosphorylase